MSAATKKATLTALEGNKASVSFTYNPKQLQIQRQVQWQQHKSKGKGANDGLEVEFTQGSGRVLSAELMLDGYEQNQSIRDEIDKLDTMLTMQQIKATDIRPPRVHFSWGSVDEWLAGVLTQLNVTITMFNDQGQPLRATVSISLQEAKTAIEGKASQ